MKGLLTVHACSTCGNRSFSCERPEVIYDTPLSKLRCGYTIPNEEKVTINANIQQFRSDVDTLNHEIAELRFRIKQAQAQRSEIEKALSYQAGLLSPIRNLPEEILIEILKYCSPGRVDVCSPSSDIWQLEKVCKRWQNIMLSTQTIWSSVDIFLGSLTSNRANVSLATVEHLIKRCVELSRDNSLSIRFVEIGSPEHFKHVFGLLSDSSHRWTDVSFSLSMITDPPILEFGLSRLRTLRLSGAYKGVLPFNPFQNAQQLSELRLFSLLRPFYTLVIPWQQLCYFQAVYCDFRTGEFTEMLQHMPHLVGFCSKWSKGLLKNRGKPVNPITFHFLQSFEIEAPPAEICTVLQSLSLPVLNELYLATLQYTKSLGVETQTEIANSVVSLIHRSPTCRITTLSLSSIDGQSICRILEGTPDVTKLFLNYVSSVELALNDLSTSDRLVPRMSTFSLTCKTNQVMFSIGPLAEIIRLRNSTRHPTIRSTHPGALHTLNLTVRGNGAEQFGQLLEPLSRNHGVFMNVHSLEL